MNDDYVVSRRKSTIFTNPKKFGEGHIPGETSKVGPGSYDVGRRRSRHRLRSRDRLKAKFEIFGGIKALKKAIGSKGEDMLEYEKKDINEISKKMGCRERKQMKRCNLARAPRFSSKEDNDKPGPGTYGNLNENYGKKKFFRRCYQDFNVRMNVDRSFGIKVSDLAPGMYDVKDSFCKKSSNVSSMGGSQAKTKLNTDLKDYFQSPCQYNIKTGIEEFLSKKYLGCFRKAPRFPNKYFERIILDNPAHAPKNSNDPGPAHYNPTLPSCKRDPRNSDSVQNVFPPKGGVAAFNSSAQRIFSFLNVSPDQQFQPGPGRYYVTPADKNGNSYGSVFKSKGKILSCKQFMAYKERIKSSSGRKIPECILEDCHYCLG